MHSNSLDPIQEAFSNFQKVETYQTTVKLSRGNNSEIIRYFYKKPRLIRMEFVTPHNGTVLIYSSLTGKAKLWPFGFLASPALSLNPDNKLIQSPTGMRVDRSDVGALYQNIMSLQAHGKTKIIGTESIGGQAAMHICVEGDNGFYVGAVSQFQLWLDVMTGFPLKVESYNAGGNLIETVEMTAYKFNPEFPNNFFHQ